MTLAEADISKLLREGGANPALPFLLFSSRGDLVSGNNRGLKILELSQKDLPKKLADVSEKWTFFNEEMSGPAILNKLLMGVKKENKILAQLGVQIYRLWTLDKIIDGHILMQCELVRKGDLMQDKESRQHLFRVLAHEIRTSTQILSSYVEMTRSHDPKLASRMEEGVKRLERAVALLQELKSELEL
jgi:signal transduction histidine kinase